MMGRLIALSCDGLIEGVDHNFFELCFFVYQ